MRIFTIGETTYDILFRNGQPASACSGGSAYNSAISLGRCGLPVSLISTFGNDAVGELSHDFLLKNGVNCSYIKRFNGRSRVALAFFDRKNNADYSFYPASEDIFPEYPVPQKNDILLLGSSFALRENGRGELLAFLQQARDNGCITIYDPNARQIMIDKPELLKKIITNMGFATIIKGSDQDFRNIYGVNDGISAFFRIPESENGLLVYTKGVEGAEFFARNVHLEVPAKATNVVSTIGAGDNFSAGIVYRLFYKLKSSPNWKDLSIKDWKEIMSFGAFFASAVCSSNENYIPEEIAKKLRSGNGQKE